MIQASPSAASFAARAPAVATPPRRLVIADDPAEMRQFVRSAVGPAFGDVVEVCDGRELFWTLLRARFAPAPQPDMVVITDLAAPAYNGLDVLDAWQDDQVGVPTIVMTAFPSAAVRMMVQDVLALSSTACSSAGATDRPARAESVRGAGRSACALAYIDIGRRASRAPAVTSCG
jgi:CheY-like chemotaxis protein